MRIRKQAFGFSFLILIFSFSVWAQKGSAEPSIIEKIETRTESEHEFRWILVGLYQAISGLELWGDVEEKRGVRYLSYSKEEKSSVFRNEDGSWQISEPRMWFNGKLFDLKVAAAEDFCRFLGFSRLVETKPWSSEYVGSVPYGDKALRIVRRSFESGNFRFLGLEPQDVEIHYGGLLKKHPNPTYEVRTMMSLSCADRFDPFAQEKFDAVRDLPLMESNFAEKFEQYIEELIVENGQGFIAHLDSLPERTYINQDGTVSILNPELVVNDEKVVPLSSEAESRSLACGLLGLKDRYVSSSDRLLNLENLEVGQIMKNDGVVHRIRGTAASILRCEI